MTSLKKNRQFYLTAELETQGSKKEARVRVGHLFRRYLDGPALQKPEGELTPQAREGDIILSRGVWSNVQSRLASQLRADPHRQIRLDHSCSAPMITQPLLTMDKHLKAASNR